MDDWTVERPFAADIVVVTVRVGAAGRIATGRWRTASQLDLGFELYLGAAPAAAVSETGVAAVLLDRVVILVAGFVTGPHDKVEASMGREARGPIAGDSWRCGPSRRRVVLAARR